MTPDTASHPWRARCALTLTLTLTCAALGALTPAHAQTPPADPADPAAALPLVALITSTEEGTCARSAFSADGALLAVYTDDHALKLVRTADGVVLHALKTEARCPDLHLSPDGALLILKDQTSQALSTASGKVIGKFPKGHTYQVGFSEDGGRLAAARLLTRKVKDGEEDVYTVEVWDAAAAMAKGAWPAKPLWAFTTTDELSPAQLIFSRDSVTLVLIENPSWDASCGGGDEWIMARTFNATTGAPFTDWHKRFRPIDYEALDRAANPAAAAPDAAAPPPDDPTLAAAPDADSPPDEVSFERLISGFLQAHVRSVVGPDTLYVFTDDALLRWDLDALAKDPATPPTVAAVMYGADDFDHLEDAALRADGTLLVLDYNRVPLLTLNSDGTLAKHLAVPTLLTQDTEQFQPITLSPAGDLAFIRGAHQDGLWSVDKEAAVACLPATLGKPVDVDFSPRGDLLLIRHTDRTYLWRTADLIARGPDTCAKPSP